MHQTFDYFAHWIFDGRTTIYAMNLFENFHGFRISTSRHQEFGTLREKANHEATKDARQGADEKKRLPGVQHLN